MIINGENIAEILKSSQFVASDKTVELKVLFVWRSFMPSFIQNQTKKMFIKNDLLFVQISSASLRHYLQLNEKNILNKFKQYNFDIKINGIIFM